MQASPANPPAAWLWRPTADILGSTVHVRIGGSFTFPPPELDLASLRRIVFIAGGVGVNPFMSMLSFIAQSKIDGLGNIDVGFVYASKLPSDGVERMLFLDRITRLYETGKVCGSVEVFATGMTEGSISAPGTREVNGAKVKIHDRRLLTDDLRSLVGEISQTAVYICGPQTMTDDLGNFLTSQQGLGMDSRRVLTEKWW